MTVVVGVDGPSGSRAAIRLADQEASYRGAALLAVMAYSGDHPLGTPAGRPLTTPRSAGEQRAAAESDIRTALRDALGERGDGVEVSVEQGIPGRVLVGAARDADAEMIVLATRGSMARLIGSVSQYVLREAPCPVLVVPEASKGL
jgi:nucleotide-binding universal stress UspA family protein